MSVFYQRFVVILFVALFYCPPVWAACSPIGEIIYNEDLHVMQYCDGSNWIEMGHSANSGTANCSNPTEPAGTMVYNADYSVMQYCNGADWVSMGTVPFASDALGIIGRWKLDESSGTVVHDTFGLNDGAFVNSPTWQPSSGYLGGAVDFDGGTDYISVPYDSSLTPANFTVSLWANRDVVETAALFKSAGGNGWSTGGYRIVINGSTIDIHCNNGSTNYGLGGEWGGLQAGEWFNIILSYDGTNMQSYYNGAPGKTVAASCGYTDTSDMWFGLSSGVEEFDGKIDDVRLFDSALSATKVNNLFIDMTGAVSDVTSGLVGHWKLDESSGTIAADSSGNGFDGTLYNSPTWDDDNGMLKGSLFFYDSDLSYVNVPYNATLMPTSGITYSLWIYVVENGSYERIIHRRRDYHDVRLTPSGAAEFKLRVNGTTRSVNTGASASLNAWHHVVGTYNGSEVAIYLDGIKRSSTPTTGSIDAFTNDLSIGRETSMSNVGEAFDGYIDDVRLYNRGLSEAEVKQLYFYREHRPTFTPSTCINPAGDPGDMIFNTNHSVMQYCNGANWIGIGK